MIKATDLRIGNFLKFVKGDGNVAVSTIYPRRIETKDFMNSYRTFEMADYEPIQLTSDWLLKAGFENWGTKQETEFDKRTRFVLYNALDGTSNFEVHFLENNFDERGFTEWIFSVDDDEPLRLLETDYVHNLQNAFYLVAGYELDFTHAESSTFRKP